MKLVRSQALRALAGAVAAPGLTLFPARSRAQGLTTVKVGAIPVDVSGNVYYTQDLGLFRKAGLDVQITPMTSGPVLAQAVAGGAIDIGISNVATIAAARLRGLPFRFVAPAAVVLPGQKPTDVVIVLKDSTITPGAGMNGKTIGINGLKDLQEIEARGFVDRFGGDSSTVRFVEIPFPAMGGALQQKRVDVIFPTEPFSTADLDVGKVIGDAFDGVGPRFMLLGWFADEKWLAANASVARRFAAAVREGSAWANAHHAQTAQMLPKFSRVTEAVAASMVRADFGQRLDPALLLPVVELAARYQMIPQSLAVTELIWRGTA